MISEIIKILLIIFVLANIVIAIHPIRPKLRFTLNIWKRFRIKMFFEVIGLITITIMIFVYLYKNIPFLNYGWLNLFFKQGGTIIVAPIAEESKSPNLIFRLIPPAFFFLFLLAIPSLAKLEEEIYRKGHMEWKDISIQSIKFGFAHLIMGVPIAVAIALIFTGIFYGYKYRRAFLKFHESEFYKLDFYELDNKSLAYKNRMIEDKAIIITTTYHSLYNSILAIGLIIVSILLI